MLLTTPSVANLLSLLTSFALVAGTSSIAVGARHEIQIQSWPQLQFEGMPTINRITAGIAKRRFCPFDNISCHDSKSQCGVKLDNRYLSCLLHWWDMLRRKLLLWQRLLLLWQQLLSTRCRLLRWWWLLSRGWYLLCKSSLLSFGNYLQRWRDVQ